MRAKRLGVRQSSAAFGFGRDVVRRPDEERKFVGALGYQLGESVFDPAQNVHLQLCTHAAHPAVEIIWPGDTTGPVDKLAQHHTSGII